MRRSNQAMESWFHTNVHKGEKVARGRTAKGDISRAAKLDIRIDAFHRLRVGSSPVIRLRCINSYASRGSADASRSGTSRISSGRSERSPTDKRLLRPLSGLKSFWGRIWKKPPEAVTAKRRRIPGGPHIIYKKAPRRRRKVHTGITAQIDESVVGLRADKENVREDLIQNCKAARAAAD